MTNQSELERMLVKLCWVTAPSNQDDVDKVLAYITADYTPKLSASPETRDEIEFRLRMADVPEKYIEIAANSMEQFIEQFASQREIEVLERTQRDFVHGESSEAFDEGRQYEQFLNRQLINELKKQKEEV